MNLRAAFDDLALMLGYESGDHPPEAVRERILRDLNAAVQQMHAGGEDFQSRQTHDLALEAGVTAYDLPLNIQTVLEPAVIPGYGPLRRLRSMGEVNDFPLLYLGQMERTMEDGTPLAYYAEPYQNGEEPDNVAVRLHVLPPPADDATVNLTVRKEPLTFTTAQLDDPAIEIPVPHAYVASIFLPIARWMISAHPRFYREDMREVVRAEYERALGLLGLSDPRRPKPAPETEEAAA